MGCHVVSPHRSWSFSQALYSHYSNVLKDACIRLLEEYKAVLYIVLSENDPDIFTFFVEYMVRGDYMVSTPPPKTEHPGVSIDAQAWVLGDRLQALEFKNHAMERLYSAHVIGTQAITPADVDYAFRRSAPASKLRAFYKHLLGALFSDRERAQGSYHQWWTLIVEHEEVGMFIVIAKRHDLQLNPSRMNKLEYYLDVRKAESENETQSKRLGAIVPAKRKADNEAVKGESEA